MPKTKTPLTPTQLEQFLVATNRVSLESLRYAGNICGYTPLLTETVKALEKITDGDPRTRNLGSARCRQLQTEAAKLNSQDEPLLHPIKTALAWASTDGTGAFEVGNIVDPIYHARLQRNQEHDDEAIYQKLEEIRNQWLTPYYEQLKKEQG